MRSIPQAALDILSGDVVPLFALINIQTPTPILATNCHRDIEHLGVNYSPDIGVIGIPQIKQEFSLSASSISLTFSDSTQELLSMAANSNIYDAQIDIHIAVLSPIDDSTVHVIESIYRGYLFEIKPGNHQLTLEFQNHMAKFDKTAGRRTNSVSQNRFYPNDKGFENLSNAAGGLQL